MAVENSTVARPYAQSAFEWALAQNQLVEWAQFLEKAGLVTSDKLMQQVLHNPLVPAEQTIAVYQDLTQASPEQVNFLKLLQQYKRLEVMTQIKQLFAEQLAEYNKTITVDVMSFMPMTDAQKQHLKERLSIKLKRDVALECAVDDALIGGAVIQAGDYVIDGSIRGKLNRMNHALTE